MGAMSRFDALLWSNNDTMAVDVYRGLVDRVDISGAVIYAVPTVQVEEN